MDTKIYKRYKSFIILDALSNFSENNKLGKIIDISLLLNIEMKIFIKILFINLLILFIIINSINKVLKILNLLAYGLNYRLMNH